MKGMRLIDANALLDQNNWTVKQYSEEEADAWRDGIDLMKKNIEYAPTIDPETLRLQWISVKNKLPEYEEFVLVVTEGVIDIGRLSKNMWGKTQWKADSYDEYGDIEVLKDVTHWMPLPEEPSKEED